MIAPMGVFKKRNRWYLRLPLRADGRRPIKSLGPHIKTKAEALAAERELARSGVLDKLAHLDPSRKTLGQLRKEFLANRPIKPKSKARYDVALRMLAESVGDSCLIRTLTAERLRQWAGRRFEQGLSPAGVNCDLRHIRAALYWAEEVGWLERAPKVKMLKAPKRPRHIRPNDIDKFLAAEADPARRRLWIFLIYTGCRRTEAHGLRWQDVSWDPYPSARVTGKGDKVREVPLVPQAVEALGERKDIGPVFPQVHPDTYTHWFQETAKKAEIKARLHDLRHTAITYMLSRGVRPRYVQEIAGHASFLTTEQYSKALVTALYQEMMTGLKEKD